jgi:hypothetical protein
VPTPKISDAFGTRLSHLNPDRRVKAVVILRNGRQSDSTILRHRKVRQVRDSAGEVLKYIDEILDRFNGHRLAAKPNALGYIAVETTPAGIRALANSEHVRAVLEDQPISLAR